MATSPIESAVVVVVGASRRFGDLRAVQWRIDLGILPPSPSSAIDDLRHVTSNSRRRFPNNVDVSGTTTQSLCDNIQMLGMDCLSPLKLALRIKLGLICISYRDFDVKEWKIEGCKLRKMLIPRCEFDVEITDASGTVTVTMSDKLAERMLSMTAEQIYEITVIKKQLIHVEHIREELSQKWFKVHSQKSLIWMRDKTPGSLVILSLSQKETIIDLPLVSTPTNVAAPGKRKLQSIVVVDEYHVSSAEEALPSKKSKTQDQR